METGDKVKVIKSPYSSVKVGTIAVIEEVRKNHFMKGRHLYVLADLPCNNFREEEITIIPELRK